MSHTCDGTLSTLYQQGQQAAILSWFYTDISDGSVIQPTSPTVKLFDPNDVQRDPTNTATITASTTVPTRDSTGAVTGSVGKYYITVNFDANATTSSVTTWYIQTTFTWENVTTTKNICFNLVSAGAGISVDGSSNGELYASVQEVSDFMTANQFPLDANSPYTTTMVTRYIQAAMDEIDGITHRPFRSISVVNEPQTILWNTVTSYWIVNHYAKVKLNHWPIKAITSVQLLQSNASPFITLTEGRNSDFYADYNRGDIYLRKISWPIFQPNALQVSYTYGEDISNLPGQFKMACILRAAWYILQSDDYTVLVPEGGDTLRTAEKIDTWDKQFTKLVVPYRRGLIWH